MADDEIMDMTVSELELYRRQMFLDCFPKGSTMTRQRLIRDILMLKSVSDSKSGAEAVEVARKTSSSFPKMKTNIVTVSDAGDAIAIPEPVQHYNNAGRVTATRVKREKRAADKAAALVAAGGELEVDTMEIRVPGAPATKRGPAVAPATTRVSAPKPIAEPVEEKKKPGRPPRAKKEPQGVGGAAPVAAPPPVQEAPNPFSRYVVAS